VTAILLPTAISPNLADLMAAAEISLVTMEGLWVFV
jgi:hypothetical protein